MPHACRTLAARCARHDRCETSRWSRPMERTRARRARVRHDRCETSRWSRHSVVNAVANSVGWARSMRDLAVVSTTIGALSWTDLARVARSMRDLAVVSTRRTTADAANDERVAGTIDARPRSGLDHLQPPLSEPRVAGTSDATMRDLAVVSTALGVSPAAQQCSAFGTIDARPRGGLDKVDSTFNFLPSCPAAARSMRDLAVVSTRCLVAERLGG